MKQSTVKRTKKRVLSIDGGGVLGLLPSSILKRLEEKLIERDGENVRITDYFDLITGTSVGGLLSAALSVPDENGLPKYSADTIHQTMKDRVGNIFKKSVLKSFTSLGGIADEKYSAKGLESTLEFYYEKRNLNELLTPTVILSYEIERGVPLFFRSERAKTNAHYNFYLTDVVRAATAAPTYFESPLITSKGGSTLACVDGALFANSPALCGFAEMCEMNLGIGAEDIILCSIGTGDAKKVHSHKDVKDWGLLEWSRPAIQIMMRSMPSVAHYQLRSIYGADSVSDNYFRFDREIHEEDISFDIDDASEENIAALLNLGEQWADHFDEDLDRLVAEICE